MRDVRAAQTYARALFGLAEPQGQLEAVNAQFQNARKLIDQCPEILHLVSNSTISTAEKEDFLDKIMQNTASGLLVNFLKVLVKKKRFKIVSQIQEAFQKMLEAKQGIQEVQAVTAVDLAPEIERRLKSALEKKLGKHVRLAWHKEPEILGGLILRFDGKEINSAYRSRLDELRQLLMHR